MASAINFVKRQTRSNSAILYVDDRQGQFQAKQFYMWMMDHISIYAINMLIKNIQLALHYLCFGEEICLGNA